MNVQKVVDAYLCNSCGTCRAVCPTGSIEYAETPSGYVHPLINKVSCVDCGLCEQVCPGLHGCKEKQTDADLRAPGENCVGYIGKATDSVLWRNGQSGGAISAVLEYLFASGEIKSAVVTELSDRNELRGQARIIRNSEGILPSQKSKYTPIPLVDVIRDLKSVDYPSAIVGLPCHVHGVLNLISTVPGYRREDFLLLGLFCQHVMTTAGIDYLLRDTTALPHTLVFRDTSIGGFPGYPTVRTESGRRKNISKERFAYVFSELTPLRCKLCLDKTNTMSDISFGDPHRIAGAPKKNKLSAIIARTEWGKRIIGAASSNSFLSVQNLPASEILEGQRLADRYRQAGAFATLHESKFGILPDYLGQRTEILAGESAVNAFERSCRYADLSRREELMSILKSGEPKPERKWISRIRKLIKRVAR